MKEWRAKIILLCVSCLILVGGVIWFVKSNSLYYYHGLRTSRQLQTSRIVMTKNYSKFNRVELNANLPIIIKAGRFNRVQVFAQDRQKVRVRVKRNRLFISSAPDVRVQPLLVPFFKPDHLHLNQNYIVISIKSGTLKQVVRTNSAVVGDLTLKNLHIDRLQLNGSGQLNFDHLTTQHQLLINSQHGNIKLHQVTASMLNLTTGRGSIQIDHSRFNRKPSQIISDSSDINLYDNQWNRLWAKTSEGNVNFQHQNSQHLFKILTNDGNINGQIDAPQLALINYYSDNGTVDVFHNLPTTKARYYSFYSDNGNIYIRRGRLTFNN